MAIADRVYANRLGNGSVSSSDGSRFRGRGGIHLTGKINYKNFSFFHASNWNETINFIETPFLLEQAKYCARSAVYFWLREELYSIADEGDEGVVVDKITKKVNLHTTSYNKRREYYMFFHENRIFEEGI